MSKKWAGNQRSILEESAQHNAVKGLLLSEEQDEQHEPIPIVGNPHGRPVPHLLDDPDETLCFCYHIPVRTMVKLIQREQSNRIADYSRICFAGVGCGSCRADMAMLIEYLLDEEADQSFD